MNATVLVIDDESFIRDAVQDILDFSGIGVVCAANGVEGIAQFEKHRATIKTVLLDMRMPIMDGQTTLRHLRAIDQRVKVILCSGLNEGCPSAATNDEALFFLPKPYTLEALLAMVQKTLA